MDIKMYISKVFVIQSLMKGQSVANRAGLKGSNSNSIKYADWDREVRTEYWSHHLNCHWVQFDGGRVVLVK